MDDNLQVLLDPETNTYGFFCTHKKLCGKDGVKFSSTGWPTDELARIRGSQHWQEHETKVPMQSLHEFREEHNISSDGKLSGDS